MNPRSGYLNWSPILSYWGFAISSSLGLAPEAEYKQPLQDGSAKPDATWGYPYRTIKEDKDEDDSGGAHLYNATYFIGKPSLRIRTNHT
ncbi:hypothetical protein ACEPAH_2784 [Sanghuangporus vaninii]